MRNDIIAREMLKTYMTRTRKALEDIDPDRIDPKDRAHVERKLADTEVWLDDKGVAAVAEELSLRQRNLELAMNAIMIKLNSTFSEFWNEQATIPEGQKLIGSGGWYLESGLDIRELFEDPD